MAEFQLDKCRIVLLKKNAVSVFSVMFAVVLALAGYAV